MLNPNNFSYNLTTHYMIQIVGLPPATRNWPEGSKRNIKRIHSV